MDIISDIRPVAQKDYWCDACRSLNNSGLSEADMAPNDWQIYRQAVAEGSKILKGQQYCKVVYKDGGELVTYRGRLDIDNLCSKYEVWDD